MRAKIRISGGRFNPHVVFVVASNCGCERRIETMDARAPVEIPVEPSAMAANANRARTIGYLLLLVTSIGWGMNWPVTKRLLAELPPLSMRGISGVIGAFLLAGVALAIGQSLKVPRAQWPRLVLLSSAITPLLPDPPPQKPP